MHGAAHASLEPLRLRIELARDLVVPLAALEDDEVLEQTGVILLEGSNLDGASGAAAGGQEPVAIRERTGGDVLHLARLCSGRAEDGEWHDAAAVEK